MGELIKPYYLHEHMQFLLPYLRKSWDPECCNKILLEESESRVATNNQNKIMYLNSTYEHSDTLSQEGLNSVYLTDMTQYSTNEYKRRRASQEDNQNNELDYPAKQFKNNKISSHPQDHEVTDDEDYNRLFMLSLLPDLEEMNNAQMRKFKIKVSALINHIIQN